MQPAQASEKNEWVQDAAARFGIYDVGGGYGEFFIKEFCKRI